MDRRPTLEARPPVLIEAVVRTLIPPACREHVVGDLWERYRSPWQFALDAARTIPFVLASQIRRTSTVAGVVIHVFLLLVGFSVGAGRPWPAVVAAGGTLLGFVLRDAYRLGFSISVKQVSIDLVFGGIGLVVSQAIVALALPGQLLPLRAYAFSAASFGVLFLLRLQNPNLGGIPRQAMIIRPATREALVTEIRLFERMSRRGYRIEAVMGVALAGFFIMPAINSPNGSCESDGRSVPLTHSMSLLSSPNCRSQRCRRTWISEQRSRTIAASSNGAAIKSKHCGVGTSCPWCRVCCSSRRERQSRRRKRGGLSGRRS